MRGRAARRASGILLGLLLGAPLAACGGASSSEGVPRVLLVTLDTLRADRLGAYGNDGIDTPHLDGLAREGTLFEKAFSPVPSTLPSHCTILTGTHPLRHGVHDNAVYRLEEGFTTLAERLVPLGFRTAAFVSAFVLDPQFGTAQGFETYDAEMHVPLAAADPDASRGELPEGRRRWIAQIGSDYQRRAESVTDRALAWLEAERRGRFLLWVHYFDPHLPYQAPDSFATRYDPGYRGRMNGEAGPYRELARRAHAAGRPQALRPHWRHMVARYDGEIAYLDAQLGRLFDGLRAQDLWDNTLVVVVGDHGESFGEHGVQIWGHERSVYDEVLRVPLLVRRPDGEGAGERRGELASTLDVVPTVLDWLGEPVPAELRGRSLLARPTGADTASARELVIEARLERQAFPAKRTYLGLRTSRYKYVEVRAPDGALRRRLLFDLEAEPRERSPLESPGDERLARWRDRLAAHRRALERSAPLPARGLDELTSDALRELGYLRGED